MNLIFNTLKNEKKEKFIQCVKNKYNLLKKINFPSLQKIIVFINIYNLFKKKNKLNNLTIWANELIDEQNEIIIENDLINFFKNHNNKINDKNITNNENIINDEIENKNFLNDENENILNDENENILNDKIENENFLNNEIKTVNECNSVCDINEEDSIDMYDIDFGKYDDKKIEKNVYDKCIDGKKIKVITISKKKNH